MMSRLRFFILLSSFSLVLPFVSAQESPASDAEAPEASAQLAAPGVQTFRVNPVSRPLAILAPNALVPGPPEPIDTSKMKEILAGLDEGGSPVPPAGSGEAGSEPELDHIVLTPREPYFEGKGYLTLTMPRTFHPESAIVFDENSTGSVGVKLMVEKDGLYLVDFAVRAMGAGAYTVETESGGQGFKDSDGSLEHVLIALSAGAQGWTTVRMNRSGAGFNLYSIEVSRTN